MEAHNLGRYVERMNNSLNKFGISPTAQWSTFYTNYQNMNPDEFSSDLDDKKCNYVKFLDLSNKGLTTVPSELSNFKNLEALNLTGNPIKKISNILKLKKLKALILDLCHIKQADVLTKLPDSLLMLSMAFCTSTPLSKSNKFGNLVFLAMPGNSLNNVDFLEENFPELIELDLSNNNFKEIPSIYTKLTRLQMLDLANTGIQTLQNIKQNHPSIKELVLVGNRLKSIPDNVRFFTGLRSIHLQKNPIESISKSICAIPLEHVCATPASEMAAKQLFEIDTLTDLDINSCPLGEIPESVGKLTNIQSLSLSKNRISNVSSNISKCIHLKSLNLNDNHLTELPQEIEKLTELTELDLSNNLFSDIPNSILSLLNLESLMLQMNYINEIPEDIKNLVNINTLALSRNQISSIPADIKYLKKLSTLMISNNKLQNLPNEIGELSNLEDLSLDGNALVEYPCELADLQKLNKLYTYKNDSPLTNMPQAKGLGLVQLFEFLNKKRGRAKYAVEWDIPMQLQTAFQQYMNFFTDYVLKLTGHNVVLEVNKTEKGLSLVTQTTIELSIDVIDIYLTQFIGYFIKNNTDELNSILEEQKVSRQQAFEVRQLMRDLSSENRHLREKLQGHIEKIIFLSETSEEKSRMIADLQVHLRFFTQDNSSLLNLKPSPNGVGDINVNVTLLPAPTHQAQAGITGTSDESFLADMLDKAVRMLERKRMEKLEDLHNNDFAHFFRDRHYYVTDQTQSGIANSNMGELDIMIRKSNGTPVSIIEAFKLSSCGEKNTEISSHIDKLLHNYDTAGLQTNYVVVYALSKKFEDLWTNYVNYIRALNDKPGFTGEHRLVSFVETSNSSYSEVKVGLAIHKRNGSNVRVYHVFINMYNR